MVDLSRATSELVFGQSGRGPALASSKQLLDEGLVHADFYDPDWVFLVRVTQVSRVALTVPDTRVARVDGVDVYLVGASIDNYLTLVLEGRKPPGGQLGHEHAVATQDWAAPAAAGGVGQPPRWPAERLARIEVTVTDDQGSAYQMSSAEAGGEDSPWRFVQHFRATPPPTAATLFVRFQSEGGFYQRIELPLTA